MTDRLRQQADLLRNRIQELLGVRHPVPMVQDENYDRIRLLETYQRRLEQSLAQLAENQRGIVGYDGKEDGVEQSVQQAIRQNQALIFAGGDRIIDVQHEIQVLRRPVQQYVKTIEQPPPPDSGDRLQNGQPASQGQSVQNGDQAQQSRPNESIRTCLLPAIKLPKFDGDVAEWFDFWSLFRVVIHENDGLTNLEKMIYLLGQLEGTARAAVTMAITDENYNVAVQRLERRFGRRELIVNMQWAAIFNLSAPSENVKQLRAFYDKVQVHLGILEQIGEETDNQMLAEQLLGKLPGPVQYELRRGKIDSTRQLRTLLNQYLLPLEADEFVKAASQVKPNLQVKNFNRARK